MLQIRLSRPDPSYSWGFRLEGGVDFPFGLHLQQVKPNSIAEKFGLQTGDQIIKINESETRHMRHEDAKMEVIRSGNDLLFTINRGDNVNLRQNSLSRQENLRFSDNFNSLSIDPSHQPNSPLLTPSSWTGSNRGLGANHLHDVHQVNSPSQYMSSPHPAFLHSGHEIDTENSDDIFSSRINSLSTPSARHHLGSGFDMRRAVSPAAHLVQQNRNDSTFQQSFFGENHSSLLAPPFSPGAHLIRDNRSPSPMFDATNSTGFFPSAASPLSPSLITQGCICCICNHQLSGEVERIQNRIPIHVQCLVCSKCGVSLKGRGYFFIKNILYCQFHAA